MTGKPKTERNALDRLVDVLVEDILNTSDEDILAEFRETHGDPERHAANMRAVLEKSIVAANKKRLFAAKAGVAASRHQPETGPTINITAARARLRAAFENPTLQKLTLAARNESEMSDSDVLNMLDDLRELGVEISDSGENGNA